MGIRGENNKTGIGRQDNNRVSNPWQDNKASIRGWNNYGVGDLGQDKEVNIKR